MKFRIVQVGLMGGGMLSIMAAGYITAIRDGWLISGKLADAFLAAQEEKENNK